MNLPHYGVQNSQDSDRRSRLTTHHPIEVQTLRERAASQPPRAGERRDPSSPAGGQFDGFGGVVATSPWSQASRFVPLSRSASLGIPQSVPTRSSSFSHDRGGLSNSGYRSGGFSSTFEDDESEVLSDDVSQYNYDQLTDVSQNFPRRPYSPDNNRSRSQSLANLRTTPRHSLRLPVPGSSVLPQSWKESHGISPPISGGHPVRVTQSDFKPHIGAHISSFSGMTHIKHPVASSPLRSSGFQPDINDISNHSPFLRDVNQIFSEEIPFVDTWGSANARGDETRLPGSGTTSRRHSVSVIKPRRGTLGGIAGSVDLASPDVDANLHYPNYQPYPADDALSTELGRLNLDANGALGQGVHYSNDSRFKDLRPSQALYSTDPKRNPSPQIQQLHQAFAPASASRYGAPGEPLVADRGRDRGLEDVISHGQRHIQPDFDASPFRSSFGSTDTNRSLRNLQTQSEATNYTTEIPSPRSAMSPTSANLQSPFSAYQPDYAPSHRHSESQSRAYAQSAVYSELGKGVPLHSIPTNCPLFIVEFKAGRTDLFYSGDSSLRLAVGDLVIVEADRGRDLGKLVNDTITPVQLEEWQNTTLQMSGDGPASPGGSPAKRDLSPKRIYGKASSQDVQLLLAKVQDEEKALQLCQSKIKQKRLPMEVIDAEYQWDRRKLTFYFIAEKRIDFRELVRELFRLYKTRIWMASLSQTNTEGE